MALHLMLDIETLGTRPSARVIEIGWATFDPVGEGVLKEGSIAVDVGSQAYGTIDAGTVDFWLKQPDIARLALAKAKKVSIKEALEYMDKELSPWGQFTGVWSHGPAFDVTILQGHYDRLGRSMPWSYRAVRDTRTLASTLDMLGVPKQDYPTGGGVAHSAVGDCVNQAVWVQRMNRALLEAFHDPLA